jgi:hypothetical protein
MTQEKKPRQWIPIELDDKSTITDNSLIDLRKRLKDNRLSDADRIVVDLILEKVIEDVRTQDLARNRS